MFITLKKYRWVIALALVVAAACVGVYLYQGNTSQAAVSKGWGEMYEFDQVGDAALTAYMKTVLWQRCPFYVPDGSGYRDCLRKTADEAKAAYPGGSSAIKEIENYCQSLGKPFEGLPASEFIVSCEAYRFSLGL